MADAADFPFRGWITWLTPGQGGRDRPAHSPHDMALLRRDRFTFRRIPLTRPSLIRPAELDAGAWRSRAEGRRIRCVDSDAVRIVGGAALG
jgi:hypothetical protein